MVSKVAVIALVAIVACPILLGYGLNLQETTKTGYEYSGESTNITNLLQNGSAGSSYTYAHSDIATMNTDFSTYGDGYEKYPFFEKTTTTKTSREMYRVNLPNESWNNYSLDLTPYKFFYIEFESKNIGITFYKTVGGVEQYETYAGNVYAVLVEHVNNTGKYTFYYSTGTYVIGSSGQTNTNINRIVINGGPTDAYYCTIYRTDLGYTNNSYADISAGYHFARTYVSYTNPDMWPNVKLPDSTKQFTVTMNLDSITASSYALHLDMIPEGCRSYTLPYSNLPMALTKTTTGGVAKWTLTNENDASAPATELYTDPAISSNTYQFTISADNMYDETTQKYYLVFHVKAAYIGDWPTLIGVANPYLVYDLDYVVRDNAAYILDDPIPDDDLLYRQVAMKADNGARTPIIRIDDALYRAFEYKTITDRTFLPTTYGGQNPGITLSKITMYGSSITFGGQTFAVNNAAIVVNGKTMKLNGMIFNSEYDQDTGTYSNRINGELVSTTASDPGMKFGGSWSASVNVQAMRTYTYTSTDWTPGQFAWDGIDQNFLIVGLLTSLGAFIALGIYIRRTKAALWPLLIVCGGAAMLFFVML